MIAKNIQIENEKEKNSSANRNQAILKTLTYIRKDWDLSYEQMAEFVHIPGSTLQRWATNDDADISNKKNELELLTHFIAIHKSLSQMFSSKNNLKKWLDTKHPQLHNAPSDTIKSSIEGLIMVRRYLDFQRGRGA